MALTRRFDHINIRHLKAELALLNEVFKEVSGYHPDTFLKSKAPNMYELRALYYHEIYHNFPLASTTIATLLKKDKDALVRAMRKKHDKQLIYGIRAEFYYQRALLYENYLKTTSK